MYIALYLLALTGTTVAKGANFVGEFADLMNEIGEKGYTIDRKSFMEVAAEHYKAMKKTNNKVVSKVISFIPVANYIYSKRNWKLVKESLWDDPDFERTLRPLTEEEKRQFEEADEGSKTTTKYKRASMIMDFAENREKNDDYEIVSESVRVEKPEDYEDDIVLLDEKLIPLAYTLDEVKRLNDATDGCLRLGRVDDTNIAIIGVPEDEEPFERVILSDTIQSDVAFVPMSEEECKDSCFLVYPYSNEYKRAIEHTIEMIRKDRKIQSEIPRIDFPVTSETTYEEGPKEHSAPTLMKSIGRMRY